MPLFDRNDTIVGMHRGERTRVSPVPCRPPPEPSGEPIVTIKVFRDGDGTDVQVDFKRDPKAWQRIRDALAAVKEKIANEFMHEDKCPARPKLSADFTSALPGGKLDDTTFEQIESALDKAGAACRLDGRWLTLPERVAALASDAHE